MRCLVWLGLGLRGTAELALWLGLRLRLRAVGLGLRLGRLFELVLPSLLALVL
jgi:hypothetical protein